MVEPAAYWILEQVGEESAVVDQISGFLRGLAGKVTEEDLATSLGYAGFAEDPGGARQLPGWDG